MEADRAETMMSTALVLFVLFWYCNKPTTVNMWSYAFQKWQKKTASWCSNYHYIHYYGDCSLPEDAESSELLHSSRPKPLRPDWPPPTAFTPSALWLRPDTFIHLNQFSKLLQFSNRGGISGSAFALLKVTHHRLLLQLHFHSVRVLHQLQSDKAELST